VDENDFGSTLRRLRDHVAPDAVGVTVGPRRRAVGLRREELAGLAGISADYLLVANAPHDALMGSISAYTGHERNTTWRHLVGPGSRAVHTDAEQAAFEESLVAGLRMTVARYPLDRQLQQLVRDLRAVSPRFVELWASGSGTPAAQGRRKVIEHPLVGRITLDCDALVVAPEDLCILAYTAEPATVDAERLALAVVLGTQSLVE
jgi:hypothetical protein